MGSPLPIYDPHVLGFEGAAHATYDRLRATDPFHWSPRVKEWIVTRHADVKAVLRAPLLHPPDLRATFAAQAEVAGVRLPALELLAAEALFLQSPPGHATARRFLTRVLAPQTWSEASPLIARLAAETLQPIRAAGGGDFIAAFAQPIPARFMGDLLGIPSEDLPFVLECSEDVFSFVDRGVGITSSVEINSRLALMADYLVALCRDRRAKPQKDGITRAVELVNEDSTLDDRTVAVRIFFAFLAALDTTTTFLGKAMLELVRHPAEKTRWERGEVPGTGAVEELLRYTSPVHVVIRQAEADGEICGHPVAAGQRVAAVLAAANRDPEVFADPHRLDLGRERCPHVAFGEGLHGCLGAALARLEGVVALGEFVRLPNVRLAAEPKMHRSDVLPRASRLEFQIGG